MINVREATIKDLDGIVAIETECFLSGDRYTRRMMAERITGKDYYDIPEEKSHWVKKPRYSRKNTRGRAYGQKSIFNSEEYNTNNNTDNKPYRAQGKGSGGFIAKIIAMSSQDYNANTNNANDALNSDYIPNISNKDDTTPINNIPTDEINYDTKNDSKAQEETSQSPSFDLLAKPVQLALNPPKTQDKDGLYHTDDESINGAKQSYHYPGNFSGSKSIEDISYEEILENIDNPVQTYWSMLYPYHNSLNNKPIKLERTYSRKYYVAEEDGKIIGYGEVAIQDKEVTLLLNQSQLVEEEIGSIDEKVGGIISIGVLPDAQGKGVGSLILAAHFDYLKQNDIRQVFAHAWPNGGFPYLGPKNGFERVNGKWSGRIYSDKSKQILYYKNMNIDRDMDKSSDEIKSPDAK
jgi:ribosomal protein S18 acetylase RimI-like enzyme